MAATYNSKLLKHQMIKVRTVQIFSLFHCQGDNPLVGPSTGCIERLSIVSLVRPAGCRGQSSEVQGSATDADPSHRLNKRPDLSRQAETLTDGRKMNDAEKRRIRRLLHFCSALSRCTTELIVHHGIASC